jgi:hypothetical protein
MIGKLPGLKISFRHRPRVIYVPCTERPVVIVEVRGIGWCLHLANLFARVGFGAISVIRVITKLVVYLIAHICLVTVGTTIVDVKSQSASAIPGAEY